MNLITISGRLTRDAELSKVGANNTPKLKFSLAVERNYQKDKNNKLVDYIDCSILGARAESLAKYMVKGKPLLVTGELNIDKYKNDKGENRTATVVKVDRIEFLASGNANSTERLAETPQTGFDYQPAQEPLNDDDIPF